MKAKLKEVIIVGLFGFFAPFLGCAALARFVLGWNGPASWLAGIALSTTSMAVVYAVMLEFGFNKTEFGKGILGACFVNDLGTVIALGLMFAPFTYRTAVFAGVSVVLIALLPSITSRLIARYGNRTAAIRTKWILLVLCGLGALALWSGSEAVLPAYIAGMVLAKTIGRDHFYIRRLRTLTIGFLTPFYFLAPARSFRFRRWRRPRWCSCALFRRKRPPRCSAFSLLSACFGKTARKGGITRC